MDEQPNRPQSPNAGPTPIPPRPQPGQPTQSTSPQSSVPPVAPGTYIATGVKPTETISVSPPPPAAESTERSFVGTIKGILSVVLFIALVVSAAALINQFIFQSYYVDGTSMAPTLANDDRLIINKIDRTAAAIQGKTYIPERGQIVVLDSSLVDQFQRNEELIKRVIGLPGDTLNIKDGKVTIKNAANPNGFDPDKQLGLTLDPTYAEEEINVTIPEGQIFVMGDNRGAGQSYDSRAFGPVEGSKVQGKLVLRIFPFNKVTTY